MLVLTRLPGQSVRVGEYLVTVYQVHQGRGCVVTVKGPDIDVKGAIYPGQEGIRFGGGLLVSGPKKRDGHATLAFSFPRDVKIVRTELEPC